MRFIQTLSIEKDPFTNSFGWFAPEYHLMSWALSCLQLHRIYKKVELYANSKAAELLIETLKLPYNKIHITHDSLNVPNENLWALPKIFTYSLQREAFLHFDGDVFLFDRLPEALLNKSLIAQNFEEATDYYTQTQRELIENFTYFPNCVKKDFKSDVAIKAVNAGVLGGNKMDFFTEYANLALKYIHKNAHHLPSININRFNVFFEQHLFYSLAKEKEIPIELLFNLTIKDNQYKYLADMNEVPCKKTYLHLLGQYKKDEFTCRLMASKLRQLYPEFYFKIIALFSNKTIPLSTKLYLDQNLKTTNDYLQLLTRGKESFNKISLGNEIANPERITVTKEKLTTLSFFENIIHDIQEFKGFSKWEIENDYINFSNKLLEALRQIKISDEYIYGRDVAAVNWFCDLFANETETGNKMLQRCVEVHIIDSDFNWAGLWNKHNRVGVTYYEQLELVPDSFYNMVILEIFGDGFSLYDIDEMEKVIFDHLQTPVSIKRLFEFMIDYVEEDIIKNHLEEYWELVIVMIKQLILKKAIMPFKSISQEID